MVVVNQIQLSQLAEEQRNAAHLLRGLENNVRGKTVAISDIDRAMEGCLRSMRRNSHCSGDARQFPRESRAHHVVAVKARTVDKGGKSRTVDNDGVSGSLREKRHGATTEYMRLGEVVLRVNRVMEVLGPVLCGVVAVAEGYVDQVDGL
ncbi:putative F-box protein [Acorus calamus]|uniref:F-box protein n=1 Tax=Acorus calamus TaxID=4465 RepID=A0AAV9D876_ACOCL|nr:putative F-box protein [Acorus calamus]